MATIYHVAEAAGVSISTVSHVLNGTRRVNPATEARVKAAMAELNYQPSSLARAMVRQETKTIAFIVPDNINPFNAEMARGIEDAGFAAGYSVMLCNTDYMPEREAFYVDMLIAKRVDGVVYRSVDYADVKLNLLQEAGIAVVVFDGIYGNTDAILLDNYHGARLAVEHLLALGHRRIACITGPEIGRRAGSMARVRAYRDALQRAGLVHSPVYEVRGDWSYQSGRDAALLLMQRIDPPTAIFASNDAMAIGVLSALHELGIGVPHACSVIGFDNIVLSAFATPPLTTVATPTVQAGHELCRLLLGRINRQLPLEPQRKTLVGELLIRGSTGPVPH